MNNSSLQFYGFVGFFTPYIGGQCIFIALDLVKRLAACRRFLFPLLHACNKGNRRRLHAGKLNGSQSRTVISVFGSGRFFCPANGAVGKPPHHMPAKKVCCFVSPSQASK